MKPRFGVKGAAAGKARLPGAQRRSDGEFTRDRVLRRGEDALERGKARALGRVHVGERHQRAGGDGLVAIFGARVAAVDQDADVADSGFPAVADQQGDVGVIGVGLLIVDAAGQARNGEAVEVEGTAGLHVDLAGKAGLDLVGRARLVDVNPADEVCRHVLQRKGLTGGGEDVATIERGQGVGQAANRNAGRFAARAVGDLHARHALQRFDDVIVGQLADVFRHDRIDDLGRLLAHVEGADDRRAHAGDDDVRDFLVGLRRGGGSGRSVGRGLGMGGARQHQREHGRGSENDRLESHQLILPWGWRIRHAMPELL